MAKTGSVGSRVRLAEALLLAGVVIVLTVRLFPSGRDDGPFPTQGVVCLIDVNASPWFELIHLPGIGETRAREIIKDRERNGPFRSVSDLQRVHGIGPATVRRIEAFLAECEHGLSGGQEGVRGSHQAGPRGGSR